MHPYIRPKYFPDLYIIFDISSKFASLYRFVAIGLSHFCNILFA